MKTLFIDTHSENLNISIIHNNKVISEEKTSIKSHSEIAIPTIVQVLKDAKMSLHEIDEIIVVNGPGSFTGVRIGVTIAKTMAYSLNIPIKTITSLETFGISAQEKFDIVTVRDNKGVYSSVFKNGVFGDFTYKKNADFDEYVNKNNYIVLENNGYDFSKILDYLKNRDYLNPHEVNPIYIKEIDALK